MHDGKLERRSGVVTLARCADTFRQLSEEIGHVIDERRAREESRRSQARNLPLPRAHDFVVPFTEEISQTTNFDHTKLPPPPTANIRQRTNRSPATVSPEDHAQATKLGQATSSRSATRPSAGEQVRVVRGSSPQRDHDELFFVNVDLVLDGPPL